MINFGRAPVQNYNSKSEFDEESDYNSKSEFDEESVAIEKKLDDILNKIN